MPTTTDDIRSFLAAKEVKYLYDSDKEVFVISFSPNVILVRLEENGEFLQFRTLNFYQYKEGNNKAMILQVLAHINYQRKLVKFGYDPGDGEINACVDIPIEDNQLTNMQFFRSMAALLEALDEARKRITQTIETGKDPGSQSTRMIDHLVEEIMDSGVLDTEDENSEENKKRKKKKEE